MFLIEILSTAFNTCTHQFLSENTYQHRVQVLLAPGDFTVLESLQGHGFLDLLGEGHHTLYGSVHQSTLQVQAGFGPRVCYWKQCDRSFELALDFMCEIPKIMILFVKNIYCVLNE